MAIEEILTRVADALEANTAAMQQMMQSAGGKAPAAGKPAGKPAGKAAAKAKEPSHEDKVKDAAEKVTAYLRNGSKEERAAAMANVQRIVEHFEADRFTNISADNFDEALDMFNDFTEGRTPEAFAEDDSGSDEGNLV